jgi:hypothetical protein
MARWEGDHIKVEWVQRAPFVEIKVWTGNGCAEQTLRMPRDEAFALYTVLGVAFTETALPESDE